MRYICNPFNEGSQNSKNKLGYSDFGHPLNLPTPYFPTPNLPTELLDFPTLKLESERTRNSHFLLGSSTYFPFYLKVKWFNKIIFTENIILSP
jgi:hypothetical protein